MDQGLPSSAPRLPSSMVRSASAATSVCALAGRSGASWRATVSAVSEDFLSCSATPLVLGGVIRAEVDLRSGGNSSAFGVASLSPITVTLPNGQSVLVFLSNAEVPAEPQRFDRVLGGSDREPCASGRHPQISAEPVNIV
jgi:hypothetical protein